jgi:hypothetical protein
MQPDKMEEGMEKYLGCSYARIWSYGSSRIRNGEREKAICPG